MFSVGTIVSPVCGDRTQLVGQRLHRLAQAELANSLIRSRTDRNVSPRSQVTSSSVALRASGGLLKLGLKPPTAFIEDEKFVSEASHQTYIAAITKGDVIWWIAYLQSTDEATLTTAFESFKVQAQRCFPRYAPRLALTDGHLPAQAALCNTFTSISIQECLLHIQRKVNTDLATYRRDSAVHSG